jgi:enterochelin esterase-like enzyme
MTDVARYMLSGVIIVGLVMVLGVCIESAGASEPISPKIRDLSGRTVGEGATKQANLITHFLDENKGRFPLIEDSLVTFVYRGRVALRVTVPSDINRWDTKANEMKRMGETDLYYLTLKLPRDARIDYKFHVDGLWMMDPLNEVAVSGGFGPNSAFGMPDYVWPPEIAEADSAVRGRIEVHQFDSKIIMGPRKIQVYLPKEYRPLYRKEAAYSDGGGTVEKDLGFAGTYPVVYVQDGGEYITLGSMVNVLDNIIGEGRIPPVVAVFIDPLDRNYEYHVNADYERMLTDEILPFIQERYDVSTDPAQNAIMGASLGGAVSFMIAMDDPEIFGKCGSQSGAFGIEDGRLLLMAEQGAKRDIAIYLDCGTFGDLTEENRRMNEILMKKGYRVTYTEFNEGHSWGNWRAHIDDMLVFFWGKEGDAE